jgi:uncharacterized alpha-E superfamily protein
MLSRVADNLYWMSRYLERAEHTTCVIGVQFNLMLEREAGSDERHWARTVRALGLELADEDMAGAPAVAQSLIHDVSNRSSIVHCLTAARENARQVREQISSEMWEQLNRLYHDARNVRADMRDPRDFLVSVRDGGYSFQGITDSTMTHGQGWQFIQAGRFLERAVSVSALIGTHFREFAGADAEAEYLEWIGLLRCCSALEAYCKAYTADPKPQHIAEFLLLHKSFPHSIRFAVDSLEQALQQIGSEMGGRRSSRVERIAGKLRATLGFGQIDEITSTGLDPFLAGVLRQCGQLQGALYQTYIAYPIEAALEA